MTEHEGQDVPLTVRNRIRIRATETLPPGSRQYQIARFGLEAYRQLRTAGSELVDFGRRQSVSHLRPFTYERWLAAVSTSDEQLAEMADELPGVSSTLATVVILPGPGSVEATVNSLDGQVLPPTAIIDHHLAAGDGLAALAEAMDRAPSGAYVLSLVAGDELEPDAIARIVDAVDADPRARVVTWDDDVRAATSPGSPLFHPTTYSPDVLLSANPFGRSFAVVADAARKAGGLRPELGTDSYWDLLLRLDLGEAQVLHVPRVLGHLVRRPPFVGPHGPAVVAEHLGRLGVDATTSRRFGAVHLQWPKAVGPSVSIVVPSRHNEALLGQLFDSLRTTDYDDWELIVVDNGARNDDSERFYRERAAGIKHQVLWWDEPFNYSAVNNSAARLSTGEVLVLLNDDTVIRSPEWLRELTGWLGVPGVGTVGVQLIDPDGLIQHGGAIVGAAGMADHRFQGMSPHSETILGSTDWYHDSTANTGACVAIRRDLWNEIGGFDEKFVLCGSDVVLGMDVRRHGLRNVCTPAIHIDHLESATRKTDVPVEDIFASYWRYARSLRFGDPYHNPNVSLISREPKLRAPDEPTALERVGPALGRSFGGTFHQTASDAEARAFASACRATRSVTAEVESLHAQNAGQIAVKTVNWFVPDFDNPFYGGLATIFRIADHLRLNHGVENRFVIWGKPDELWTRSGLAAIFPGLETSELVMCPGLEAADVSDVPYADVSIATQWQTAYQVAHFQNTLRKFYLIQDFEPMFNPAGTLYALAEETYKLGLLGLCNTERLFELYEDRYDGAGSAFTPAVDQKVFHAEGRSVRSDDDPINLFVYARPGHWRNCWELAEPALRKVKENFGSRLRIVTAGAWTSSEDLKHGMDHLGLLDYVETGDLYRTCDLGLSLTVSEHPSYLPLELMACGVPVVAFDLPAGYWILHDEKNSLLAKRTVDGLVEQLTRLVEDAELRTRLRAGALTSIAAAHSSWEKNLSGVYGALSGPLDA